MSGIDRQLQQAFRDLVFKEGELFPAVVQSVDKKKKSLTVVDAEPAFFSVAIIPYTYEHTRFKQYKPGNLVNIEFDMVGKYVQQLVAGYVK